jgi:O-antigen/teichoic acid export membrane protein
MQTEADDILRSPEAGKHVIRGGTVRGLGYGLGVALTAVASVFLLRYLGVDRFGEYVTVLSLMAIVSGITDAGLTAVGARELALREPGEPRRRLLENLIGLRLVLTPLGVVAAVIFALVAGYGSTLVIGTALAGVGLVMINAQATLMLPLSIELRIFQITIAEVLKQAVAVIVIALLVVAGSSFTPFFTVQIAVGIVLLGITPWLVGRSWLVKPAFTASEWRFLIREALPIAAFLVMNVLYFRILIILMSLLATATATGLFATSFRIYETLFGLPALVLSVALPVMATAEADRERLRYQLQRMVEVGLIVSAYLVLMVVLLAEPLIRLLGGSQYLDAVPLVRIQSVALLAVFLSLVCQFGLIAIRKQGALAIANGIALATVIALGVILISLYADTGAAVAAVIGETILMLLLLRALRRSDRLLFPNFAFAWKVALAGAVASVAFFVPFGPIFAAVFASVLFAAVIWLTGVLPPEIAHALLGRAANGQNASGV